ncbi:multiple coagulation factor deficiency protein 2 homolog isoform X2 [Apostichopus japonicus]
MCMKMQVIKTLLLVVLIPGYTSSSNDHSQEGEHLSKLHDSKFVADADHIKEHHAEELGDVKLEDMSQEELEFRFFSNHDFNNDTNLDGLELYQAFAHSWSQVDQLETQKHIVKTVDLVLETDDLDKDGYITYQEYTVQRRRMKSSTTH